MVSFIWLVCVLLHRITQCTVNIASNNEAWYCNNHPLDSHSISPLSNDDLGRIRKLKQVHVMTRHGTRTHSEDIQQILFPNSTQSYECDISTITSRVQYHIDGNPQYFVPMETIYQENDQYLAHSNCQRMQSHSTLIQQHQQNAQLLINAYMRSDDASQLFDIYQSNQVSVAETKQQMKVYTSNRERCIMSTMVLLSTLLNISASNASAIAPTIETIMNDMEFNPYATPYNAVCTKKQQWSDWNTAYHDDIPETYIKAKRDKIESQSEYTDAILAEYKDAGGKSDENTTVMGVGFSLTFYYCNGFDIPLSNATFWRFVESSHETQAAMHPNRSAEEKTEREHAVKEQCYNHFMAIPMYSRFVNDLQKLLDGDADYDRFILHSAHDSSIAQFLTGLGLHDGVQPYFAQMFTLEIYAAKEEDSYNREHNITYLFRFTNKGEFVAYAPCETEYAADNGSELCDLNVLLNNGFKDVNMTQRYWADTACDTVLDDCVCGYCNPQPTKDDNKWMHWLMDVWQWQSFVLGVCCSLVVSSLVTLCITKCYKHRLNSNQRNYQRALTVDEASDIELQEQHDLANY